MYDLCVLGGGIIGATAALSGAREGLKVCIVERDSVLLRGSTMAGFGALTPYSDPFFVGEPALFAEHSLKLYQKEWLGFLYRRTEINVPISRSGLLQIAVDNDYLLKHKSRYEGNCIDGYRPEYLSQEDLRREEPNITIDSVGAIYHPEPWIDLEIYMAAIGQCVQVFSNIDVLTDRKALKVQEHSDFVSILLDNSDSIKAKKLVVATGLSHESIEGLTSFPISWVRGDGMSVRTRDDRPIFKNNIYCTPGFIAPRNTGEMLLGSTYIDEGIGDSIKLSRERNRITFGALSEISAGTRRISSALDDCHVEREWHGWRPCSADDYPILGVEAVRPRTIYALGFLGLGITMSVAVGESICDYSKNDKNKFPNSMNPERFRK